MKIQNIKKGFTLIELLVVITIMGILATWATAVYTSQIQKARDSTRVNDITALRWGIEQLYQDTWNYPNMWVAATWGWSAFIDLKAFVPKLPKDPKTWQKSNNSNFDYTYTVGSDSSWIAFQTFEVSWTYENSSNITNKATWDWWNDNNRQEMWININALKTQVNRAWLWASWVDSATPVYICETQPATVPSVAATTNWTCPGATSTTAAVNTVWLIIR